MRITKLLAKRVSTSSIAKGGITANLFKGVSVIGRMAFVTDGSDPVSVRYAELTGWSKETDKLKWTTFILKGELPKRTQSYIAVYANEVDYVPLVNDKVGYVRYFGDDDWTVEIANINKITKTRGKYTIEATYFDADNTKQVDVTLGLDDFLVPIALYDGNSYVTAAVYQILNKRLSWTTTEWKKVLTNLKEKQIKFSDLIFALSLDSDSPDFQKSAFNRKFVKPSKLSVQETLNMIAGRQAA